MPALALQAGKHDLGYKAHVGIAAKYFKPLSATGAGGLVAVGGKLLHASRGGYSQKLAFARIDSARKGVVGKGIAYFHRGTARHQGGKQAYCKDDKRALHGYNLLLPARNAPEATQVH